MQIFIFIIGIHRANIIIHPLFRILKLTRREFGTCEYSTVIIATICECQRQSLLFRTILRPTKCECLSPSVLFTTAKWVMSFGIEKEIKQSVETSSWRKVSKSFIIIIFTVFCLGFLEKWNYFVLTISMDFLFIVITGERERELWYPFLRLCMVYHMYTAKHLKRNS